MPAFIKLSSSKNASDALDQPLDILHTTLGPQDILSTFIILGNEARSIECATLTF